MEMPSQVFFRLNLSIVRAERPEFATISVRVSGRFAVRAQRRTKTGGNSSSLCFQLVMRYLRRETVARGSLTLRLNDPRRTLTEDDGLRTRGFLIRDVRNRGDVAPLGTGTGFSEGTALNPGSLPNGDLGTALDKRGRDKRGRNEIGLPTCIV